MIDVNSSYPLQTQGFYKYAPVETQHDREEQQVSFTAKATDQSAAQAEPVLLTGKSPGYSLSSSVTDVLLTEQEKIEEPANDADRPPVMVDTNKGKVSLDDYFNSDIKYTDISDVPLMNPSRHNVDQLTAYVGDKMKTMMTAHNIPEPPSSFRVNSEGEIIVPDDYAYKEAFIKALEADESLKRQIDTLNGITGHYAGLQAAAQKAGYEDVDQDVLLALLEGEQTGEYPDVSFSFKPDGTIYKSVNGITLR